MTKKSIFLLLLFTIFPTLTFADDTTVDAKRVAGITIEAKGLPPGSDFQTKSVETKLKTKVGEPFSQTTFDQDLKALSKDYENVDPSIKTENSEVYITLEVSLRPSISAITFNSDSHFSDNKLRKELSVEPQTQFDRLDFNKSFQKLRDFFIKKGYFETQLEYKVNKDPLTNEVAITISIKEGRAGLIKDITYVGFSPSEVTKVKEKMLTKKFNPFTSWVTKMGIYNEDMLEYDKMNILQVLRDEGYANAKIELEAIETNKVNRIALNIVADKGEVFHFGEVSFDGNEKFDAEAISKLIEIKAGEAYSPKKIQDTTASINKFYGQKGYIDAAVSYEPHLQADDNSFSVKFKIDEGEAFKVGLIKVMGNYRTKPKAILRETLLEPGGTFNTHKLEITQKRLENIGLYKHINVYASAGSQVESIKAPLKDVNIEVQETSTGSMMMFGGYSSTDSGFGGIEVSERNFNLLGIFDMPVQGFSALRGAGEFFKIKTSLGIKLNDYEIAWSKPFIWDTNWIFGVNLNKNFSRVQSSEYNIESFSARPNLFYPLNAYMSFMSYYRFRDLKLHVNGGVPLVLYDQAANNGNISALGLTFLYNSANGVYRITKGFVSSLSAEYAGLGGNFKFFNLSYNNSFYQPITKKIVAKTKADFGFIIPTGKNNSASQIPLGERFFLAGDVNGIRGLPPFSVGPHQDGIPLGGISQMILSQEVSYSLMPGVDFFTFFDAGSLDLAPFSVSEIRASCGVGARLKIANIPLMVGWGYPLNPPPPNAPNDKQKVNLKDGFFVSMSGQF